MTTVTASRQADPPNVRVSREIPLWGILCTLGVCAIFCISLYYNILSQNEKLIVVQASLTALNTKIDNIDAAQSSSKLKDLEHDLKITSVINRLVVIEGVMQRQMPPQYAPPPQYPQYPQYPPQETPQQILPNKASK